MAKPPDFQEVHVNGCLLPEGFASGEFLRPQIGFREVQYNTELQGGFRVEAELRVRVIEPKGSKSVQILKFGILDRSTVDLLRSRLPGGLPILDKLLRPLRLMELLIPKLLKLPSLAIPSVESTSKG